MRFGIISGMTSKRRFLAAAVVVAAVVATCPQRLAAQSVGPGSPRFATDAYPGFDSEENILRRPKKEPGFFSWWSGPKMDAPGAQLEWAKSLEAEGSDRAARKAYDALVAEWPSSPEAPIAQRALADNLFSKALDYPEAFEEYKYLADYYPSQCDYDALMTRMYETAQQMRIEGKRIFFIPFKNTTDVRRAFEAVVMRAPGATFAPAAMIAAGELREDEGELEKAVEVYETIRNLHPSSPEAEAALVKEATDRMTLLRARGYNKVRCLDTVSFLKSAVAASADRSFRDVLARYLAEAVSLMEDEAYKSAKYYDSRTRTRRSAVSAYERFLVEFPASVHADSVRERLAELRGEQEAK